jgi:hypothetical protein
LTEWAPDLEHRQAKRKWWEKRWKDVGSELRDFVCSQRQDVGCGGNIRYFQTHPVQKKRKKEKKVEVVAHGVRK